MTQSVKILKHLRQLGHINKRQARVLYSENNLYKIIYILRQRGFEIEYNYYHRRYTLLSNHY